MLFTDVFINYRNPDSSAPRIGVLFSCGDKTRRIPLTFKNENDGLLRYTGSYVLSSVFYKFKPGDTVLSVVDENGEIINVFESVTVNSSLNGSVFENRGKTVISSKLMNKKPKRNFKDLLKRDTAVSIVFGILNFFFKIYKCFHRVKPDRVAFVSGRRSELDGNMLRVYNELKKVIGVDIKTLFFKQLSGKQILFNAFEFMKLYAESRVIVVDDYFRLFNYFDKPEGTKIIQLWHACGAFKTFGYSRIGKPGGPSQYDVNHRMYDYAVVSSPEVARHYAEGFGISDSCVVPLGVARTDVFFSEEYKQWTRRRLYEKYPSLNGKRVALFAPTFRGDGQQSAYYPTDRLDINALMKEAGEDTALIIKLHPFCKERYVIDGTLKDRVIDLSDSDELNDLLFITDLLITDYSSAVFEASLLNIKMLFYAFDLEEYISERDFYYNYSGFVPGEIVRTQDELLQSINNVDTDVSRVAEFKERFFTSVGNASESAAELITSLLEVDG
ncbi:MAG: CDP-glycerol glycerophosphotransferase family protein [Eubacterium sp.]|nr:CDP-glycerol glycerophosphotransferase family protein [Eubacterium sp.]